MKARFDSKQWWSWGWLGLAALGVWLSAPGQVIPLAAWLSGIALLRFWRTNRVRTALLGHYAVMTAVSYLAYRQFIPAPNPLYAIITVVSGLMGLLPPLLDRLLARRIAGFASTLVFPMASVALEFASAFAYTGTIASVAQTQAGNLPLLQLVAVTGVWGITFLISWCASVVNWAWEQPAWPQRRAGLAIYGGVMGAVLVLGGARLALAPAAQATVRVAGVSVDNLAVAHAAYRARFGADIAVPAEVAPAAPELAELMRGYNLFFEQPADPQWAPVHAALETLYADLFAATEREARAGARIVTWSEANAFVLKADEPAFLRRAQALAQAEGIYLFAPLATITPGPGGIARPGAVENKIVAIGPDGAILSTYFKTKLPLGETSVQGDGTIPVLDTPYGRIAAVICYDMDSPEYIRQAGLAGADIILAPSGDWHTIRDWHADAAVLRAIENGAALVRPVSRGRLTAADAQGRLLATSDYFAGAEHTIVASVPTAGSATIYTRIGDSFAWLCVLGLVAAAGSLQLSAVRWRRTQNIEHRA